MALNDQIATSLYSQAQPGQKKALSADMGYSQPGQPTTPTYDWSKGQVFDPRNDPSFTQQNANGEAGWSTGAGNGSDYRNLWAGVPGLEQFNSTPQTNRNAEFGASGGSDPIDPNVFQNALTANGYTWKRANENDLTGAQMKHPGYYDWLEGANGQLVGQRRFTPDTSVGDQQAWLRMGGQALTAGLLSGGDSAVSGMDLAADGAGGYGTLSSTAPATDSFTGATGFGDMSVDPNTLSNNYDAGSQFAGGENFAQTEPWTVDPNTQYNVTNATGAESSTPATTPERGVYNEMGPNGNPVSVDTNQLAGQMPPEQSLGSQALDFAKANPQLVASGVGLALNQANKPDMPANTSTGGSTAGTSNPALIDALTQKLYGANGENAGNIDYSSVNGLKTSAGDTNQYYQTAADAMYDKQKQYLDPQVQQNRQQLEARLAEQGFVPGTPGYNQAMQNFMDTNNRAYAAARDSAIGQGITAGQGIFNNELSNANLNNSASREALAQVLARRNQPLNELSALKSGQQVQYSNDIDRYNAQVASQNSNNQLYGQLASALALYYSDARLKEDIVPIGQTKGGANLYEYTIFGRRERGVMAQELRITQPDAVSVDPDSGFLMVDYAKVR